MNKIKLLLLLMFTTILFSVATIDVQADGLQRSDRTYYETYFDTIVRLSVWDYDTFTEDDWFKVEEILTRIQYTFSRTLIVTKDANGNDVTHESELYKLNKMAGISPVKVSDELFNVIKTSIEYAEKTNGAFEPTIGPLVETWGIATDNPRIPAQSEIDAIMPLIDYTKIELNEKEKTVFLPEVGMIIDLGAIAKGYAADVLADYFRELDINHAVINLGGNIFVLGERYEENSIGTRDWKIGIRDPEYIYIERDLGYVYVKDRTLVSSGTYERNFVDPETNKQYHHILDSKTGYPVENNLVQVTIITESSTKADAMSTSLFSMGLEKGLEFANSEEDIEAIFITTDGTIYKTDQVDDLYKLELNKADIKKEIDLRPILYSILGVAMVGLASYTVYVITKQVKQR